MKTFKLATGIAFTILFALFVGCTHSDEPSPDDPCQKDPCSRPDLCPCSNPFSKITKDDLVPEGAVTETEGGFIIESGSLKLHTGTDSIVFENAENLNVNFDEEGNVESITGKSTVPNIAGILYFPNPVEADIGFYSGKHLNENYDFDITLIDSISYFVYHIGLDVSVYFGDPSDPEVTPVKLSVPIGGHYTHIANYNDPFFYFSAGQNLIGSYSMGQSFEGLIPYVPLQPLPEFTGFYGKSFVGGSFTLFKIIGVYGTQVEEKVFDPGVSFSNPIPDKLTLGYKCGINGEFELTLPVKGDFLEISMPIAEASAGVIAIADTQNGVVGKAFINGIQGVDNSWWPDFIPLDIGINRRAWGFVQQDGKFDMGISGKFFFEIPGSKHETVAEMKITNDGLSVIGTISNNDVDWVARMDVEPKGSLGVTTVTLDPPMSFTEGLADEINAHLDSKIDSVKKLIDNLDEAVANYQFELSLRGLRNDLPTICDEAKKKIADGINDGLYSARVKIDNEISPLDRCKDNFRDLADAAAKPYYDALNRLKSAASINDNENFKNEIEAALRDLIAHKKINKTVTGSIWTSLTCGAEWTRVKASRKYTLNIQVIGDGIVAKLNEAADNVKYLKESGDMVVTLQQVINQLPLEEDLDKLKSDIQSGVKQIPSFDNIGYSKAFDSFDYKFFITLSGERKEIAQFNIFSGFEIKDFLINDMME